MSHRHALLMFFCALGFIPSGIFATSRFDSTDLIRNETVSTASTNQKGPFIAAFGWSVAYDHNYVWPFESMRPAPYGEVWMVVETLPRIWPDGRGKRSVTLPAHRILRVNGRALPRSVNSEQTYGEYRVPLDKGRLRLSISIPSSYKLDPKHSMLRVRLHKALGS